MRLQIQIRLKDDVLFGAYVDTAFDATGIEAGNHLKSCLLSAFPGDAPHPKINQFLIGTAACEWGRFAYRSGYPQVATIGLSDGCPCSTVAFAPEHVRLDPEEAYVVLTATLHSDNKRLLHTTTTIVTPAEHALPLGQIAGG